MNKTPGDGLQWHQWMTWRIHVVNTWTRSLLLKPEGENNASVVFILSLSGTLKKVKLTWLHQVASCPNQAASYLQRMVCNETDVKGRGEMGETQTAAWCELDVFVVGAGTWTHPALYCFRALLLVLVNSLSNTDFLPPFPVFWFAVTHRHALV